MTEKAIETAPETSPEAIHAPRRKVSGLGRGLGALLGEARREEPLVVGARGESQSAAVAGGPNAGGLATLAVSAIRPHRSEERRVGKECRL